MDIWTNSVNPRFFLIWDGGEAIIQISASEAVWQSLDFDLTQFAGADLTTIRQIKIDGGNGSSDEILIDNLYFYKTATLGIDDSNAATIGIYPNPTNGRINVTGDVYSVTGQKLLENTDDLSILPSGIYFVRSQGSTSKVIKN